MFSPMAEPLPFPGNKRYNAYTVYLRNTYGGRLQKISIDAGFTCPNRDGSKGSGGCTYCSNDAFVPGYCREAPAIGEQVAAGMRFHDQRYPRNLGFLAYLQAFTNTHCTPAELDALLGKVTAIARVRGVILGTRPDCLPNEILDVLQSWAGRTELFLELGVESTNDEVLAAVNRCHDFASAESALHRCHDRGLRTGVHLISGLPGESRASFLAGADRLSQLPVHSLKIHQLQVFKDTPLARSLSPEAIEALTPALPDYLDRVIDFLERLSPQILIDRVTGEAPPHQVLSKTWGLRTDALLRAFEDRLLQRATWQGRLFASV
jgi:radical SAM protein (TIGR01212 family)